jgi:hypothetical protein
MHLISNKVAQAYTRVLQGLGQDYVNQRQQETGKKEAPALLFAVIPPSSADIYSNVKRYVSFGGLPILRLISIFTLRFGDITVSYCIKFRGQAPNLSPADGDRYPMRSIGKGEEGKPSVLGQCLSQVCFGIW